MTQRSSAKGKKRRKKPEKLEFVQDFIPIKDLRHGIIETTDGRYIKILEIEPINFMLRSDDEQFSIISTFASWLKISPMKLQFKSITRRADSDKHVAMVREELEAEPSEECKRLGEDYINLIKDVGSREALTRRFFLIFQYEEIRRSDSDDFSQIFSMMQTAEQNARAYFMQCGNNILQPEDPDEATAEILYMFFNRRSCIDEPFSSRVERVVVDTMAAKNKIIGIDEVPHIRFAHFIAPRGIDLKHHNYVIIDGLYYTFLYIKGDGYPSRVRAGWMSALINAGEGGKLLPVGMMIALDYVWDSVKKDLTKKKAVMIDEIWKLVGTSSNKRPQSSALPFSKPFVVSVVLQCQQLRIFQTSLVWRTVNTVVQLSITRKTKSSSTLSRMKPSMCRMF